MRLKITAKFESSSHDGYCSGGECEYECETITKIIDADDIDFDEIYEKDGRYFIPATSISNCNQYFKKEINLVDRGSSYCDNSVESEKNDLGCHDFRLTPLSIEVRDTQFLYLRKKIANLEKLLSSK